MDNKFSHFIGNNLKNFFSFNKLSQFLCIFLTIKTYAATPNDTYSQCTVTDTTGKQWVVKHQYERTAINLAVEACKKESTIPISCKSAHEACESFTHGISNRPLWRCTALDRAAKSWVSNTYDKRDDAALAAKAYCQENSTMPGTCYINMLTCKNLNSK